jgi:hypothetical protein
MSTVTSPLPRASSTGRIIRGESQYDRTVSGLIALILGVASIVGWLTIQVLALRAFEGPMAAPLEIIEVSGGGGGTLDGTAGESETIEVPGAAYGAAASNNESNASEFEEPSVAMTPDLVFDGLVGEGEAVLTLDLGPAVSSGGAVATGKRSSQKGTGRPGYGFGPGTGGVPREQRWNIVYESGQTVDEYAKALDAMGVEVAVANGNQLTYAKNLSSSKPTVRTGSPETENRLYFLWLGGGRKAIDQQLFRNAGIDAGQGAIFHFYSKEVADRLAQLEVAYARRQPGQIKRTRFRVSKSGAGYDLVVASQEPLR